MSEIRREGFNIAKMEEVIIAHDTILHFHKVANMEGILALEDESAKLGEDNEKEKFFAFLIEMLPGQPATIRLK